MSEPGLSEMVDALRACLQDQVRVVVYLGGTQLSGQIARLDSGTVELREGTQRLIARLDRIDAIRRE